jgi:AcrR family transcriptional regulator
MMVSTRQTAPERRIAALSAAVTEFSRTGYEGTSTEAIATRAGISQPYLFRLFGTKKELFIAAFDQVGTRIVKEMSTAAKGLSGEAALEAMGTAYFALLQDDELLKVQMHGYAAATNDPDIAAIGRKTFNVLWHMLNDELGLDEKMIGDFFARGMLISVMSAIDLLSVAETWAQSICPAPENMKFMASKPAPGRENLSSTATTTESSN